MCRESGIHNYGRHQVVGMVLVRVRKCGIQGWPSYYSVGYSAGWYHAQGDWNTLQYGLYSYGNSACPRGHSILYCNGYHAGYIDLWNYWIYNQENWINFVNTSQRSQQVCSIINGLGVMCM